MSCLDKRNAFWNAGRLKAIQGYGGKCACCGETEPRFLQIDHIHGNGSQHRKEVGHKALWLWLARNGYPKDDYQLLCCNCNFGRGHNGGICPHQEQRAMPAG